MMEGQEKREVAHVKVALGSSREPREEPEGGPEDQEAQRTRRPIGPLNTSWVLLKRPLERLSRAFESLRMLSKDPLEGI